MRKFLLILAFASSAHAACTDLIETMNGELPEILSDYNAGVITFKEFGEYLDEISNQSDKECASPVDMELWASSVKEFGNGLWETLQQRKGGG